MARIPMASPSGEVSSAPNGVPLDTARMTHTFKIDDRAHERCVSGEMRGIFGIGCVCEEFRKLHIAMRARGIRFPVHGVAKIFLRAIRRRMDANGGISDPA